MKIVLPVCFMMSAPVDFRQRFAPNRRVCPGSIRSPLRKKACMAAAPPVLHLFCSPLHITDLCDSVQNMIKFGDPGSN